MGSYLERLPKPRFLLAVPAYAWWALFFVAPAALLIAYSFGTTNALTLKVEFGWTTQNYAQAFGALYRGAIFRSFVVALGTTVGCLVIGFPAALYISRKTGRVQRMLLLIVIIPFWTSFVVRAYAWVDILQNGGPMESVLKSLGLIHGSLNLLYTQNSVMLVMIYGYLPLMILPLFIALERIDPNLLSAAADLGASGFKRLLRVTIPLAKPGILAGCILVGVPAMGEYTIPALLGGGKVLMFGNVIAQQFQLVGNYSFGAALAASLMAIVVLILLVFRPRATEVA